MTLDSETILIDSQPIPAHEGETRFTEKEVKAIVEGESHRGGKTEAQCQPIRHIRKHDPRTSLGSHYPGKRK
jgi:hypothetical protein